MFDGILDKAFEKALPKSLDLGNFDKSIAWLRDSAFSAHQLGLSKGQLRDLLHSWLKFAIQFDDFTSVHINALIEYVRVIYFELTDTDYSFSDVLNDEV